MTERLADRDRRDTGQSLPIEKLVRVVDDAQGDDAEGERRLLLARDERQLVKRRMRKKLQYWAQGSIR